MGHVTFAFIWWMEIKWWNTVSLSPYSFDDWYILFCTWIRGGKLVDSNATDFKHNAFFGCMHITVQHGQPITYPVKYGMGLITHSRIHYNDVIMSMMASQITSLTFVYSTVYSGADQRKHQGSASLVFVWGTHRGPVNSPHKWPVTRKIFPFHDVIMLTVAPLMFGKGYVLSPTQHFIMDIITHLLNLCSQKGLQWLCSRPALLCIDLTTVHVPHWSQVNCG